MTNNIKIMLLNVNGLNLQETYLSQLAHNKLIYGYRNLYRSTFKEGCRRGVETLVSNTTQFDLEKEYKDKEGRYIVVKGRLKKSASNINKHICTCGK